MAETFKLAVVKGNISIWLNFEGFAHLNLSTFQVWIVEDITIKGYKYNYIG